MGSTSRNRLCLLPPPVAAAFAPVPRPTVNHTFRCKKNPKYKKYFKKICKKQSLKKRNELKGRSGSPCLHIYIYIYKYYDFGMIFDIFVSILGLIWGPFSAPWVRFWATLGPFCRYLGGILCPSLGLLRPSWGSKMHPNPFWGPF